MPPHAAEAGLLTGGLAHDLLNQLTALMGSAELALMQGHPAALREGLATAPVADTVEAIYAGTHKFGVNRVTDMARVGTVTFSRKGGALQLAGRVSRKAHWLELSGKVEPAGTKKFDLIGTIRGVPDMAWAGEAPHERSTEGRFTFEVRKNRPYFRLYGVDGRECVCGENCGNDFCYIDIEQMPVSIDQQLAK